MSGDTYLAYDYPLLSAFWTMLVFFLWIMWFVLLFRVVLDIFRDDDLSGWAKTGWLVFCIVLPFVGVFVYVIARGRNMGRRETAQARDQQKAFDSYIRETAKGGTLQQRRRTGPALRDPRPRRHHGRGVRQGQATGPERRQRRRSLSTPN